MVAGSRKSGAAVQTPLTAGLIELIEVRTSAEDGQRIGYVVHNHSMCLARACGIPKVFLADRFHQLAGIAERCGLRFEVVRTVRH